MHSGAGTVPNERWVGSPPHAGPTIHLDQVDDQIVAVQRLGTAMLRVSDPTELGEQVVRVLADDFGLPAAAWTGPGTGSYELIAAGEAPTKALRELGLSRIALPLITERRNRSSFVVACAAAFGSPHASLVDAEGIVVVFGADSAGTPVASLLREWLPVAADRARDLRIARDRLGSMGLGLSCIAHELVGPLGSLRMGAHLLLDGTAPDGVRSQILGRMIEVSDELADLVTGLLPWAVGVTAIRLAPLDLQELVSATLRLPALSEADRSRLTLRSAGEVGLLGDAQVLGLVIANALRNALRYSMPGTSIEVSCSDDGPWVLLGVDDIGLAVSEEERLTLFDPFIRGSGTTSSRDAHGLGLYIIERAVSAHGGDVWFEPRSDGAALRIRLPKQGP
jgi:signal transduction histidine kinase